MTESASDDVADFRGVAVAGIRVLVAVGSWVEEAGTLVAAAGGVGVGVFVGVDVAVAVAVDSLFASTFSAAEAKGDPEVAEVATIPQEPGCASGAVEEAVNRPASSACASTVASSFQTMNSAALRSNPTPMTLTV